VKKATCANLAVEIPDGVGRVIAGREVVRVAAEEEIRRRAGEAAHTSIRFDEGAINVERRGSVRPDTPAIKCHPPSLTTALLATILRGVGKLELGIVARVEARAADDIIEGEATGAVSMAGDGLEPGRGIGRVSLEPRGEGQRLSAVGLSAAGTRPPPTSTAPLKPLMATARLAPPNPV